jgi:hypothetical protein
MVKKETYQLQVIVLIQENVFRLEVTMDDLLFVHVLKRRDHLCCVETGQGYWEFF